MNCKRKQILVVDDCEDSADTSVELLSIWGYEAIACYSGGAGLACAARYQFDAVLLDIAMPLMDGFQFAILFHEVPNCGQIPLIALSGYSGADYRVKARAAGICHYLIKPAPPQCIQELLLQEIPEAIGTEMTEVYPPYRTFKYTKPMRRVLRGLTTQLCQVPVTGMNWGICENC
jgi:CheY-like chemotaxis protein